MTRNVVVVGAGPTGLTAACELARRGVAVRVLDAATAPTRGARAKGMQPRSLELLDPLGVADRLVSLGRPMTLRHHELDGSVTDTALNPDAVERPDRPWPRGIIIPQWRTEQVLRERLAELGVVVEQDARVTGVEQDDRGVVLSLAHGGQVTAGYVVAADGGTSAVRHALGVPFHGTTTEEVRMLLADVEVDGLDRTYWHMWNHGPNLRMVALCPLPASTLWQLQVGHDDPDRTADEAELRRIVDGLGPRVRLRRIEWSSTWRLNERMVERYRAGRVFLAGDAAHVHSPAGGQGMNTGIGDAVNLSWKLAAVLAGADPALLDSYEAERLPVAAGVLGLSHRLLGVSFRNRGPGDSTLQFDVGYRGGPLAPDDDDADADADAEPEGTGPRAGDRAPDAPLAGGDTVFLARRRGEWTVLAFGVEVPDLPLPGLVGVRVDEGPAWAIYAAVPGELVLLRPDGHVAARGTDPAVLVAWTDRFGLTPGHRVDPHASLHAVGDA